MDPDKSHLEKIGVGLYTEEFERGYDKEKVSGKGVLQRQVVTWSVTR